MLKSNNTSSTASLNRNFMVLLAFALFCDALLCERCLALPENQLVESVDANRDCLSCLSSYGTTSRNFTVVSTSLSADVEKAVLDGRPQRRLVESRISSEACIKTITSELTDVGNIGATIMPTLFDLTGQLTAMSSLDKDASRWTTVFVPSVDQNSGDLTRVQLSDDGLLEAGFGLAKTLASHPQSVHQLVNSHIATNFAPEKPPGFTENTSGLNLEGDDIRISESVDGNLTSRVRLNNEKQTKDLERAKFIANIIHTSVKCNGVIHYIDAPMLLALPLMQKSSGLILGHRNCLSYHLFCRCRYQDNFPESDKAPPPQEQEIANHSASETAPPISSADPTSSATTSLPTPQDDNYDACSCLTSESTSQAIDSGVPLGCMTHRPGAYPFCYVLGKTMCSIASYSASFPGEAWRNCEPGLDATTTVLKPCDCTTNDLSGGVSAPRGCQELSSGNNELICYVHYPEDCSVSYASTAYPGAGWRECEATDIPECSCADDGVSNGVYTGRKGCALHHSNATGKYCYTRGGSECPFAEASQSYPGSGWRFC